MDAGGNGHSASARSRGQGRSPKGPRIARRLARGEHRRIISQPAATGRSNG
jgi:hypothetical protein